MNKEVKEIKFEIKIYLKNDEEITYQINFETDKDVQLFFENNLLDKEKQWILINDKTKIKLINKSEVISIDIKEVENNES